MSDVWASSKHSGSSLIILLAIADFANDSGEAFPSIATLAQKARLSDRTTQRLLKGLTDSGELSITYGTGRSNVNLYTVTLSSMPKQERVTSRVERVTSSAVKGDIAIAPEPSVTVIEPNTETVPDGSGVHPLANADRARLETAFCDMTCIVPPPRQTLKQRSAAAALWWEPLRQIAALTSGDVGKAIALMTEAEGRLRGKVTVSSPKSLLNTAVAIAGEWKKNGQPSSKGLTGPGILTW